MPTMNEVKIAKKIVRESIITSFSNSNILSRLAPKITGIESKKENFAASLGAIPKYTDIVIVAPDLEIPGIIASAWATPTAKDEKKECFFWLWLNFEDSRRIHPVNNSAEPTYFTISKMQEDNLSFLSLQKLQVL